jgi:glycosyltransferase involved in cell wall biosynthesis
MFNQKISDEGGYQGVIILTHPLSTAGETAAYSLLRILSGVTSDVTIVTAQLPRDSEIREEYDLIELDEGTELSERTILWDILSFVRNQQLMCLALYRNDHDSALFYGSTSYVLPIFVARLLGRRTYLEPRGDVPLTLEIVWSRRIPSPLASFLAKTVWLLERIGYWLATDIILYTPAMSRQLDLERYQSKIHSHGARYVDTDQFYPKDDYENRELRVGYLGRLDEEKGIRELTDAAARLVEAGVSFTFVGDGDLSGYVERNLGEYIEKGDVELVGWVDHDEVPEYLRQFRLLVMASSPTEGLPMTALESMACGTPVCAPPVAGLPDVVRDEETGILIEEINGEVIANRVLDALESGDLPEISERCVDRIETEFTFEAAVERYAEILMSEK